MLQTYGGQIMNMLHAYAQASQHVKMIRKKTAADEPLRYIWWVCVYEERAPCALSPPPLPESEGELLRAPINYEEPYL